MTLQAIIGQIVEKYPTNNTCLIEHWNVNRHQSTTDCPAITPCNGCNINHTQFTSLSRCQNFYSFPNAILINTKKLFSTLRELNTPLFELFQQALFRHSFFNRQIIYNLDDIPLAQHNPNPLLRFIEHGDTRNRLLIIQQKLLSFTNLDFYTDGSLIDLGKESVQMGFSFIQTNIDSPYIEFSASIDNFPSSTKTELAAIVSALLVSPSNSIVQIFTDCDTIIQQFLQNENNILSSTPRFIFKEQNNTLWSILRSIINISNIRLTFIKVKAHSGDHFNNKVDQMAKSAIFDTPLLLNYTELPSISYVPLWKNLYIEFHLRHFLTAYSRVKGLELWLSLQRNSKYLNEDIHWTYTFYNLNDDESQQETSFTASYRKTSKIKFLIEEIPTIEHMKLRRPDLYKHWNCQMCYSHKETFNHVWLCSQHRHNLHGIIYRIKHLLISLINQYSSNVNRITLRHLSHPTLWTIDASDSHLTFIDLIKGIVPSFLVRIINDFIKDSLIIRAIISLLYNNIYLDVMERIWKPRCEVVNRMEQHMNITSRNKKKKKPIGTTSLSRSTHSLHYTAPSFNQESLIYQINTGLSWSDFMILDNIYVTSTVHGVAVCA